MAFAIKRERDVWRLVAGVTIFALSIVTSVLMLVYPSSQWLWEFTVSWPLTIFLTGTATYFIGGKMREVHLLNEELTRLVSRDRLTDVATRDFFFKRMEEMPEAYGVSLMVDIDFFKRINDTYGHLTGDKVIAHVARILNEETRPQDLVCRFGGEEFVVFLANVNEERGHEVAERLRHAIESAPLDEAGSVVTVTASIGGSLKAATDEIQDAIKRADDALYRAKESGRNRAIMEPISNGDAPPLAQSA
ncbi:GGDEF domain-containing protein [Roseobacteraceae bacterium S113]